MAASTIENEKAPEAIRPRPFLAKVRPQLIRVRYILNNPLVGRNKMKTFKRGKNPSSTRFLHEGKVAFLLIFVVETRLKHPVSCYQLRYIILVCTST